jgi:hypothetical protein
VRHPTCGTARRPCRRGKRFPRRPRELDRRVFKHRFQILDPIIADRQFRVDHVVNAQRSLERRFLQLCDRSLRPLRVVRYKIEEYVGIDQRQISSRRASTP